MTNPEGYKAYLAATSPAFKKYGARFLVRNGTFEAVDGASRGRNVVIEFPSYKQALDCWNSPEYQAAIPYRTANSTGDIIVIEGYDGEQP